MSIFFILNTASITRFTFLGSGSDSILMTTSETTCHDSPYLSFNHPHWLSLPPPDVSVVQYSSISACVWQWMTNETASSPPYLLSRTSPLWIDKSAAGLQIGRIALAADSQQAGRFEFLPRNRLDDGHVT
jgi:hypothetical protein